MIKRMVNFFIDDTVAPTTRPQKQEMEGFSFQNTKEYFSINIDNRIIPIDPTQNVELFNQYIVQTDPSFYSINVTVDGGRAYQSLLNEITNNGFKIWWVKIQYKGVANDPNDLQLKEDFFKISVDSNGQQISEPVIIPTIIDLYQQDITTLNLDMRKLFFVLDGTTYLKFRMLGDRAAKMLFFYTKIEKSDPLPQRSLRSSLKNG